MRQLANLIGSVIHMKIMLFKFIAKERGLLDEFFSAHIATDTAPRTEQEWNKLLIVFKKLKNKCRK